MKNVLVLCTGNSCRSQMAHGYLEYFAKDKAKIYSAGIEIHGVNPLAIEMMKEDGIDISHHTSNHVDEYLHIPFDFIITVCDHANEKCPVFPSTAKKLHQNFPDPSRVKGSNQEIMAEFRRARELIKEYCTTFVREQI
jgi:arsenate reductase